MQKQICICHFNKTQDIYFQANGSPVTVFSIDAKIAPPDEVSC